MSLVEQDNNIICNEITSDVGLIIGMFVGGISGALLCGPVGFIMFAIFGMILGDEIEKVIIKYKQKEMIIND